MRLTIAYSKIKKRNLVLLNIPKRNLIRATHSTTLKLVYNASQFDSHHITSASFARVGSHDVDRAAAFIKFTFFCLFVYLNVQLLAA